MKLPSGFVPCTVGQGELRPEAVLIGRNLGLAIPLTAIAEHWNPPVANAREIESEVQSCDLTSPFQSVTQVLAQNRDTTFEHVGISATPQA